MTILLCLLSANVGFILGAVYVTLMRERADRAEQDAMVEQVMAIVRDENRAQGDAMVEQVMALVRDENRTMDAANEAARWIPERLRRRSAAARN